MFRKTLNRAVRQVHPFAMLGFGLAAIIAVTAVAGVWHHQIELSQQVRPPQADAATAPQPPLAAVPKPSSPAHISAPPTAPSIQPAVQALQQPPAAPTAVPTASPQPTPPVTASTSATVSLHINNVLAGEVILTTQNTQCDVLQKALEAGVIASLDMRYSNQYKTYAVYAINGQGDSASVWWAYTVNGKSPPYGCSKVKVAHGDTINWHYVKQ